MGSVVVETNVNNQNESNLAIKRILNCIHMNRQQTPLTGQVEDPAQHHHINLLRERADIDAKEPKRVHFSLSSNHRDGDSTTWRKLLRAIRLQQTRHNWENSFHHERRLHRPLTKEEERSMVLDGTIPSAVSDPGATSTSEWSQDFKTTKTQSGIIFGTRTGHNVRASYMEKL